MSGFFSLRYYDRLAEFGTPPRLGMSMTGEQHFAIDEIVHIVAQRVYVEDDGYKKEYTAVIIRLKGQDAAVSLYTETDPAVIRTKLLDATHPLLPKGSNA